MLSYKIPANSYNYLNPDFHNQHRHYAEIPLRKDELIEDSIAILSLKHLSVIEELINYSTDP
jgi:hypothetical protein